YFVFFSCHAVHRDLHSFPTRRSSDLPPHMWGGQKPGAEGARAREANNFISNLLYAAQIQDAFKNPGLLSLTPRFSEVWPIPIRIDRKSTRLNSSHVAISYAVFCLKKK